MRNTVYLVGGGPGAIELYTIKAMECIKEADCLIYDRLIDTRILEYVKKDCECIYVGKAASKHTLPQVQINALLIEKAKKYQKVVRLKGGDVYVFGRGGEEGIALQKAGINFEVIPGLSSAIAGLCYAGIPITHRGLATGFKVVTAHHQNSNKEVRDYTQFLDDSITYVFLMGLAKLELIVNNLLAVGKHPDTPMALISNATLPTQQTVYGTLSTIVVKFQKQPLPSPMLIVVGAVVSLHDTLHFMEQKKYFHKEILVATITTDTLPLTKYFQAEGAYVKQLQVGKIIYVDFKDTITFDNHLLVFTSRNGIRGFFKGLQKNKKDYRILSNARFACIGNNTAKELQKFGFYADIISPQANSTSFNEALKKHCLAEETMIIIGNEESSIKPIHNHDFYLPVYKNESIPIEPGSIVYDLVCFTCASSVERIVKHNYQFKKALSIGPMTSKAIKKHYPEVEVIEATQNDYQGMLEELEKRSIIV